jgi:hypothetical protein
LTAQHRKTPFLAGLVQQNRQVGLSIGKREVGMETDCAPGGKRMRNVCFGEQFPLEEFQKEIEFFNLRESKDLREETFAVGSRRG